MSNTFEGAISVVVTGVSIATSGTSASANIPLCQSGEIPKYIRIAATAPACVRLGNGTVTAVTTDLQVQPGDAVILAVHQLTKIAAIQVSAAGIVQVSPLENM
ncbi:hypothetical protein ACNFH8_28110 [Pseudomonas sp. NY15436]|uniref:hypothetical protein n=1 Tax=Pseudomonas sp. NY15436 TaxID=3400359 RepID=UPI003A84E439